MNYLLDTCTISDFFKKIPSVVKNFQEITPNQLYVSTISIMEIEFGLKLHLEKEIKIRPLWCEFLKLIQPVFFSLKCAEATSHIRSDLKKKGNLIGPYDLLIAGTAMANNLIVVTPNMKEFNRISEIKIVDWRI